jgi:hypothetical protein
MTDLLNSLSTLRTDTFADSAFTSGEDVVVVVKHGATDKPSEDRVTFRRSGGIVQALKPEEAGAGIVVTADFEKALTQLKDVAGVK